MHYANGQPSYYIADQILFNVIIPDQLDEGKVVGDKFLYTSSRTFAVRSTPTEPVLDRLHGNAMLLVGFVELLL